MEKSNIKQYNSQYKTDYDIPKFSLKSSLIILLGAIGATVIFPYVLSLIGLDNRIGVVIGNTFLLGFVLSYVRFFIETKRGFCKKFWITYLGFGITFGFISFFWMYLNTYI